LLQERHPQHRFLFNPEFLREATAHEDFLRPDRQIVGHTDRSAALADTVMALLPRAPFERTCPASEAEMAKYMANCFLALKVIYANEIADLCERLQIDYDGVRAIAGADARIGPSHLDVFDGGYRGYGGKCLPKDSKSLLDLARAAGVELQLLRAADRVNARLRDQDHVAPPVVLPLVITLIGSMPPARGVSAYTASLAGALARRDDVDLDVLSFRSLYPKLLYPGGAPDTRSDTGIDDTLPVCRSLTWWNPVGWIAAGFRLRGDIVHAQWWSFFLAPAYAAVLAVARLRGKRVVLTVHNTEPHERGLLRRVANRAVLPFAHCIIVHALANAR